MFKSSETDSHRKRDTSLDGFALFPDAQSHTLSLGTDSDEASDSTTVRSSHPLYGHVNQAVLLKFALCVEVAHEESTLLILFCDLCHQLHIKCFCEVVDVFTKVGSVGVDLDLILPLIIRPLLLEIQF